MNPIRKVTEPQSIKDSEIPNSKEANPAGVIEGTGGRRDEDTAGGVVGITGDWSENSNGVGGERRMLKIKEERS